MLYLTLCAYLFKLPDTISASCPVNPKTETLRFLMFVLWPTICARLIIYLKLKNSNYARMQKTMLLLTGYYNMAYGVWTVYNFD